ncbi:hypothetical protein ACFQ41_05790 [Lacticaseibacillus suilingensis]|uniref:Uncharacterized protein n=1 Tax=Lacticaseibacillus suilingensis TaxID=2799577 RepID=A0ABW4BG92_9LACO|nr:hypothetical protein [Lacticaseibacillus suilingensis]
MRKVETTAQDDGKTAAQVPAEASVISASSLPFFDQSGNLA